MGVAKKMSDTSPGLAWTQIVVSAFITAILSLIVSFAYFHYTDRAADLVYDISPPATFSSQALQVSIYDATVENIGDKEAEEIEIYVALPQSTRIQELVVRPKLNSIKYSVAANAAENERTVLVPRLNQGENVKLSLLADRETEAISKFEVRANGVVSRVRPASEGDDPTQLFIFFASFFAAIIATSTFIYTRSLRLGLRIDKAESTQKEINQGINEAIARQKELNERVDGVAERITKALDVARARAEAAEGLLKELYGREPPRGG